MKVEHRKGVMSQSHSHKGCDIGHSHSHSHNMRTMGSDVHNNNSSYIYSIENQMGTLLSSPCQLGLGVDLSHLG